MGLHSIAEVFAALTRLPVQPRIHPVEAARIVTENILPHFEVVSVGKEDYPEVLNTMASGGWSGARIYDALLPARQVPRWSVFTPSISGTSGSWRRLVYKRKYARHESARDPSPVKLNISVRHFVNKCPLWPSAPPPDRDNAESRPPNARAEQVLSFVPQRS